MSGARERCAATAALALAAAVGLAALPRSPVRPAACARPAEAAAEAGFTRRVRCDGRGPALRGPARLLYGLPLDLNRAAPRALEALPRIGPARAAAIARERARRPFAHPRELLRVPGIGPATLRAVGGSLVTESGALAPVKADP